ncbi:hypothetical protein B0A48_00933 [Cryoendolithus antarcticus]|uniref:Peptidase metallopeptidase domain-containing protein n=1 Tax=Cryoendolithus antarcticus TaxID=1507870 RepID=A0A1V8TRR5_9PEZI|nr:hypothetical protein B0A48_00933 [Cryoendolithus antarcticus]
MRSKVTMIAMIILLSLLGIFRTVQLSSVQTLTHEHRHSALGHQEIADEHHETKRSISVMDAEERVLWELDPTRDRHMGTTWPSKDPIIAMIQKARTHAPPQVAEAARASLPTATTAQRPRNAYDLHDVQERTLRITLGQWGDAGDVTDTDIGYVPGRRQTMLLSPPAFAVPDDHHLRETWVVAVTHEFGHAIGFQHEHQRPNVIYVDDPSISIVKVTIDRLPGYEINRRIVAGVYPRKDEPAFEGLNTEQRMKLLLKRRDLAWKYWAPQWRRIMAWIPMTFDDLYNGGFSQNEFHYDKYSIMNHNSLAFAKNSNGDGFDLAPFATLAGNPPVGPGNLVPPLDHLIWVGGSPDPALAGISKNDVLRLRKLYPPPNLAAPQPHQRSTASNGTEAYEPAFRPCLVMVGSSTVTVRPAPPIPTGNDYRAYLGPTFKHPEKMYGLGIFGGPERQIALPKTGGNATLTQASVDPAAFDLFTTVTMVKKLKDVFAKPLRSPSLAGNLPGRTKMAQYSSHPFELHLIRPAESLARLGPVDVVRASGVTSRTANPDLDIQRFGVNSIVNPADPVFQFRMENMVGYAAAMAKVSSPEQYGTPLFNGITPQERLELLFSHMDLADFF